MDTILDLLKALTRKDSVWSKGYIMQGYDPGTWRRDTYGSAMKYSDYGETTTYGWEIDHIDPDGADELWNLQPLNWLNNRRKSDKTPLQSATDILLGIKR
jgi:hypothetical protein